MSNRENVIFKQIQHDKREALNELFEQYFTSLCHFANSYLGDPMLAEEIVSDVFFNLWAKRKSLKITGSLKPYLFKATRNQAISYLRRPSFQFEPLEEYMHQAVAQSPDALLIHKENRQNWQNCIDSLPGRCRLIFTLQRDEGFTYREIADLLDISEKTVENQMSKALKLLRAMAEKTSQRIS